MDTHGPLHGIRVIERGQTLAGAVASLWLADQGADVICLCATTLPGPTDAVQTLLNRNKRLLGLDQTTPAELVSLLTETDVLIDTDESAADWPFLPASAAQIQLRLTEAGQGADNRTTWATAEGAVGATAGLFTDVSIPGKVLRANPIETDLALPAVYGAAHAVIALLVALLTRQQTGKGANLTISIRQAMLSAMGSSALRVGGQPWRYDTPPIPKMVSAVAIPLLRKTYQLVGATGKQRLFNQVRGLIPPLMNTYACADGKLLYLFAMDNAKLTRRLLIEAGLLNDLHRAGATETDPFSGPPDRHNLLNASTLSASLKRTIKAGLSRVLITKPAHVWEKQFNRAGIPCAVHQTLADWLRVADLSEAGLVVSLSSGQVAYPQPGPATWLADPSVTEWIPRPGRTGITGWPDRPAGHKPNDTTSFPSARPLTGLRVIDLASMIAGPICGRTLADYGADVIKVESPRPQHGPLLTNWLGIEVNRGKQSVVLDISQPAGRQVLDRLLTGADVLVHNFKPETARQLGLDAITLQTIHPRLIVSTITAYDGPFAGPRQNWPGYDPVLQAASGIMTRYGAPGEPELHAIASCIDYLTGYLATFGALLGLFRREQTGQGAWAKTTLAGAALYAQVLQFNEADPTRLNSVMAKKPPRFTRMAQGWTFNSPTPVLITSLDALLHQPDKAVCHEPDHPCGYPVTSLQPAYCQFNGLPIGSGSAFGPIGQDTIVVLKRHGFSAQQIQDWLSQGLVNTQLSPTYLPQ